MQIKIAKFKYKKSRTNDTCVPESERSRASHVENYRTNIQGLLCPEDDVSRERRIVED